MIVVTGGEGFIGKNLVKKLQEHEDMAVVSLDVKCVSLDFIRTWFESNVKNLDFVFHLGAITDTTEMSVSKFDEYNVNISKFIWNICTYYEIPLVYASSAATYGGGEYGFNDEMVIAPLGPLNPYGWSKHKFDLWVTELVKNNSYAPPFWVGLKFFNVYGYGEAHKGGMASMVYHTFNQVQETGKVKLFQSHNPEYEDGEQLRDFIYVDDVVDVCIYMLSKTPPPGIYNVGTGKARSFNDLAKGVFKSIGVDENIEYIKTPRKLRKQYQYFTEATTTKLWRAGYTKQFTELEVGVDQYCKQLLQKN